MTDTLTMAMPALRLAAVLVALAGAGAAATGLAGVPGLVAAGLALVLAATAWPLVGVAAIAAAVPVLGLLPGAGVIGWAGWTAAAVAIAWVLTSATLGTGSPVDADPAATARRRRCQELERHARRYPPLLNACLEISSAREAAQFARELCVRCRAVVPEATTVVVFLGTPERQACAAGQHGDGTACRREPGLDEHYVAAQARPLTRREGDLVHRLIPLRGDRRRQDVQRGDHGQGSETQRGVLRVSLPGSVAGDPLLADLLAALGRIGGLGLATVDLVNQARALALRDDLTGLLGQHEFLRRLDEAAARARRSGEALAVVMCDLDHLKRFNDEHGHATGDAALKAVAVALAAILPRATAACRYGGEEFACFLPATDAAGARAVAEALRAAISGTVIAGTGNAGTGIAGTGNAGAGIAGAPIAAATPGLRVTASLGVAILLGDETGRAALARADAACYRAKAAGRNRVEVAP